MLPEHSTSARGRLPGAQAPGPVGVSVDLEPLRGLAFKSKHNTRSGAQVPSKSLERPHGKIGGSSHKPTNLFGRVEDVDPVRGEVVRARGKGPETRELGLLQLRFALGLVLQDLLTRSRGPVSPLELDLAQKLLNLTRIGLVLNPLGCPLDDSLEY